MKKETVGAIVLLVSLLVPLGFLFLLGWAFLMAGPGLFSDPDSIWILILGSKK